MLHGADVVSIASFIMSIKTQNMSVARLFLDGSQDSAAEQLPRPVQARLKCLQPHPCGKRASCCFVVWLSRFCSCMLYNVFHQCLRRTGSDVVPVWIVGRHLLVRRCLHDVDPVGQLDLRGGQGG